MQLVSLIVGLGLTAIGLVQAQSLVGISECGQTCTNSVTSKFTTFGCASAQDFACHCIKPDFFNGVHDCVRDSCAEQLDTVMGLVRTQTCAGFAVPPADVKAPTDTAPPTTTTPITLPGSFTSTADTATATSSASVSSATTSPAVVSSSETSTPVSSSSVSSSSTSSSPAERTQSASQSSTNDASSTPAATSTSTPSPTAVPASGGLSLESRIGLGVGAAAGAMALIGLVACLVVSRRRKARNAKTTSNVMQRLKISEPITGGRTYANDHHNRQYEGENELETRSKRYEEYEPRVSPRNMV